MAKRENGTLRLTIEKAEIKVNVTDYTVAPTVVFQVEQENGEMKIFMTRESERKDLPTWNETIDIPITEETVELTQRIWYGQDAAEQLGFGILNYRVFKSNQVPKVFKTYLDPRAKKK